MKNSEVKAYLSRYYYLDKEITGKIHTLERIRQQAFSLPGSFGDGVKVSSGYDRTGRYVIKIVDLETEINNEIDKAVNIMQEIKATISGVQDKNLQLLLCCRYIECLTFEKIAERMNYSYYHVVHRLHPAALHAVKDILESSG